MIWNETDFGETTDNDRRFFIQPISNLKWELQQLCVSVYVCMDMWVLVYACVCACACVHVLLTPSLQPCPGTRCLLFPPPLGILCSWRSLVSSSTAGSRAWESKTLRHTSHSTHCRHLSASTRPTEGQKNTLLMCYCVPLELCGHFVFNK